MVLDRTWPTANLVIDSNTVDCTTTGSSRTPSVTDTSLARLDVEDLLSELLGRIRSVLDVDTAAVLLRNGGSDELVALLPEVQGVLGCPGGKLDPHVPTAGDVRGGC